MTTWCCVAVTIVCLTAVVSCSSIQMVQRYSPESCNIDELHGFTIAFCSGRVQNEVSHLGHCLVHQMPEAKLQNTQNVTNNTDNEIVDQYNLISAPTKVECRYGRWAGTDTSLGHTGHRQKRFFWMIAVVACFFFCGGGGGGTTTVTKYPPKFSNPCKPTDVKDEYIAAAGENYAIVKWTQPTATDQDGDTPTVTQVSGGKNGSAFEGAIFGREYYIVYEAKDSDGLKDSCYFSFTVTVKACSPPPWPTNGAVTCDQNNFLGSTCTYTCDEGFELNGLAYITCQNKTSPTWSAVPTCLKKHCSPPKGILNGSYECEDNSYQYQTVCGVSCLKGFTQVGPTYTRCKADVTWFPTGSSCADDTPPKIFCPTPQTFYADRGVSTASVTWQPPIAVDAMDPSPQIVQTSGPTQGNVLDVGTHVAKYKAIDRDANESPECSIELRVQELACGHPLDAMNDTNMQVRCSKSTYTYGVICNLSCVAKLPLNGTNIITCEMTGSNLQPVGTWGWGTGAKPYCIEISCPPLNLPKNGALVYDTVNLRGLYTMLCNNKYDIPAIPNFVGIFLCMDSGKWNPNCAVPDCIEPRNIHFLRLNSQIFYYGGNCGDNSTMQQIRNNLQQMIETNVTGLFSAVCPSGETCRADNPTIQCGAITNRRRRESQIGKDIRNSDAADNDAHVHSIEKRQAAQPLTVTFNIIVDVKMGNKTLLQALDYYDNIQLNILKPAVQQLITNGTFNLPGFELRNDSFTTKEYGDIVCPDGYLFVSQACKPCPPGYFLNASIACVQCPVGQYVDVEGSVTCTSCPLGFSTRQTGSKQYQDCIELCSPGSYSPDGMADCSVCPVGSYQDKKGQTSCQLCPLDRTTLSNNNTNINDCLYFDVLLQNTSTNTSIINSTATSSLTFMLWAKRGSDQDSNATVKITSQGSTILTLYLGVIIKINVPSKQEEPIGTLSSTSWTHIAFTWDSSANILSIYNNGVSVKTLSILQSTTPLLQNGSIFITADGKTGLYITGLHLLSKTLSATSINSFATSCHMTNNDDIINMNIFHGSVTSRITVLAPSACDAVDECAHSPCGNYSTACINGPDSFKCICSRGWTGVNCSVPPDYCSNNTCQNGATCINGYTNYMCTCRPGYMGTFCEVPPVDGAWSTWSQWSQCPVTCETGSRSRIRFCNSPPPGANGKVCTGVSVESQYCNTDSCPVCPVLKRQYGTLLNCSKNQSTWLQTCQLYCADGMILPVGLREFQEFRCGMETNYTWQTLGNVPSCVEPAAPRGYIVSTTVAYTSTIPIGAQNTFTSTLENNLQSTTNCSSSSSCDTTVTIGSANGRRRRNAGTVLTVKFSIRLDLGSGLQYDSFVTNQTVSGPLQNVINAFTKMELIAQYINSHASSVFKVVTSGVTYTVDASSLTITATTTCDAGYAATDGLCVICPSGTYLNNGVCSFCERGTYQSLAGQTLCTSCPAGLFTDTIGSNDQGDCSQSLDTATSKPMQTTSKPAAETKIPEIQKEAAVSRGEEIAIVLSALAVTVICTFVIIVCIKKFCWKNTPRSPSIAHFSVLRENKAEQFLCDIYYNTQAPATAPSDCQMKGYIQ